MKYHYRCDACKYDTIIEHPMTQDFIKHCPECQEESFNVVISSSPFLLKGDGWIKHEKSGVKHPKGGT